MKQKRKIIYRSFKANNRPKRRIMKRNFYKKFKKPSQEEFKSVYEKGLGKILITILTVYSLLAVVVIFAYENSFLKFKVHMSISVVCSLLFMLVSLM